MARDINGGISSDAPPWTVASLQTQTAYLHVSFGHGMYRDVTIGAKGC